MLTPWGPPVRGTHPGKGTLVWAPSHVRRVRLPLTAAAAQRSESPARALLSGGQRRVNISPRGAVGAAHQHGLDLLKYEGSLVSLTLNSLSKAGTS